MSHKDFGDILFIKKRMDSINIEGDYEGIFETISQVEEVEVPRIINTYQDTEKGSELEGTIKDLPSVLAGSCTIDSDDVMEIQVISIMVVEDNETLEENIPSVVTPVT